MESVNFSKYQSNSVDGIFLLARELCPYTSRLINELAKKKCNFKVCDFDSFKDYMPAPPPVVLVPTNCYILPDFFAVNDFAECDPEKFDEKMLDRIISELNEFHKNPDSDEVCTYYQKVVMDTSINFTE